MSRTTSSNKRNRALQEVDEEKTDTDAQRYQELIIHMARLPQTAGDGAVSIGTKLREDHAAIFKDWQEASELLHCYEHLRSSIQTLATEMSKCSGAPTTLKERTIVRSWLSNVREIQMHMATKEARLPRATLLLATQKRLLVTDAMAALDMPAIENAVARK